MNKIVITLLSVLVAYSALAQEKYAKVKIFAGTSGLEQLTTSGIDFSEGTLKKGATLWMFAIFIAESIIFV